MTSPNSQAGLTDLSYTGQRDLGMGLMDYKARFYSPTLGRFTQPDTLIPSADNPQAWNRFSYVMNSPILYNDPSGHMRINENGSDGTKSSTAEERYYEEEYGTQDLDVIKYVHDLNRKILDNLLKLGLTGDYRADKITLSKKGLQDLALDMNTAVPSLETKAATRSLVEGAVVAAAVAFLSDGFGLVGLTNIGVSVGSGVGSGLYLNDQNSYIYKDLQETGLYLQGVGNSAEGDTTLWAVGDADNNVTLVAEGSANAVVIDNGYDSGMDYYNEVIVPFLESYANN